MKAIKSSWLVPVLLTAILLLAVGVYIGSLLTKESPLSESEIRNQLEGNYNGTVDLMTREGDVYVTEMTRNGAIYSAEIDVFSGKVLSLVQEDQPIEKKNEIISEEEAYNLITENYTGDIERLSLNEGGDVPIYEVEVAKDQSLVTVIIDALAGEITSESVQEMTVEHALISREQAIEIALGQLQGEVDYVTFEQTEDGGFYLVEIEQDDDHGGDDLEAVFQIHAISGEIITVTWDD